MISHHTTPDELLAALDAFQNDQQITKGQAIRALVTDKLTQLGYLAPVAGEGARTEKLVHHSSNGDDWILATDSTGSNFVVHRANASSGGTETTTPVGQFLERSGGRPEGQAVKAALKAAAGHVTI